MPSGSSSTQPNDAKLSGVVLFTAKVSVVVPFRGIVGSSPGKRIGPEKDLVNEGATTWSEAPAITGVGFPLKVMLTLLLLFPTKVPNTVNMIWQEVDVLPPV